MKFFLDAEFEKKMPWYAKLVMALGFILVDLGMRLSGLETEKEQ